MRPLTRLCFLLRLLGRLLLLALILFLGICLPSLWSSPFSRHALALIPLTLLKVRLLLTMTLSLLMIWYSELTALFPFLLAIAATASLPTALSMALKPLFAWLGSTNKSATSPLFSYYRTLVLSSPPCPLLYLSSCLKLCGRSGRNCLLSPSVLLDYNGSLDPRFSRETTRLMS